MQFIVILFFFWIVFLLGAVLFCKELFKQNDEKNKKNISDKKSIYHMLEKENDDIQSKKNILDNRILNLSKIYESIKRMSGLLKTEDIVSIFLSFLKEHLLFSKCYLALLGAEERNLESARIFELIKDKVGFNPSQKSPGLPAKQASPEDERSIVFLLGREPRSCRLWRRDRGGSTETNSEDIKRKISEFIDYSKNAESKDSFKKDGINFFALVADSKIIAVLLIYDLKDEYSEDFQILISHVAMEFKKVNLYESVERLSVMDGLTGIYLRRYFTERLFEEIKRSERLKLKFSILMADIDYFKHCNDTRGHMVGDAVLRQIAQMIKGNIREIDLVARYGGEEFTILLPETTREGALYVAERIRKTVENQVIVAYDESLKLTVSIGISIYPDDGLVASQLIEKADKAMYESKQKGRNQTTVWQGKY